MTSVELVLVWDFKLIMLQVVVLEFIVIGYMWCKFHVWQSVLCRVTFVLGTIGEDLAYEGVSII